MLHKEAIEPGTLELLIELQKTNLLSDFYLAGGTALAIQLGHRKSIDLDLFSQHDFAMNNMLEFLEEQFSFQLDYSAKNTLKGSINNVKIDIITHKYSLVKNPVKWQETTLLSAEDIAAMKLNAITGDGTRPKDFIDVYFLLKQYSVSNLLDFYRIKYKTRNILHVLKSLNYFDDINTDDWPEMLMEKDVNLEKVRQTIEDHIADYSRKHLTN
ncbi:MAG: hypothetical protein DRI88_05105 [Bacteroidetes bacterium]|nr:MAG: hypothetical protein DRI88_05105 [Bacteroidota bacterium]RLD72157.1 MAG: hypothetical protein DRI87_06035 [Bacteroidota bacterium]RLD88037.1 MAG: hypothetical protein DRJ02_04890 [Bacteroidota bacterium]HHL57566.1 hypothetical protein [Bacteroidota bacterium]